MMGVSLFEFNRVWLDLEMYAKNSHGQKRKYYPHIYSILRECGVTLSVEIGKPQQKR